MLARLPDFKRGDKFGYVGADGIITLDAKGAKILGAIIKEVQRQGRWSAQPPFELKDDSDGRHLSIAKPLEIWAVLSGSTSPYSFVQVEPTDDGGWIRVPTPGGYSGTACAYEANSVASLDGKYVRLQMVRDVDWRFYWKQWGGSGSDCHGSFICVSLYDLCVGKSGSGTPPNLDGTVVTVTGPGAYSSTWTVSQPGAYKTVSHCFGPVPAGTYTVTITANSNYISPAPITAVVDGCNNKTYNVGLYEAKITVSTCIGLCVCGPNPAFSVAVTVAGGGGSCTTSGSGVGLFGCATCSFQIDRPPNGSTVDFTVSAPGFDPQTVTVTMDAFGCAMIVEASLNPIGYPFAFCFPNAGCVRPWPATLSIFFSDFGPWTGDTKTLTLQTSGPDVGFYTVCDFWQYGYSGNFGLRFENSNGCGSSNPIMFAIYGFLVQSDCSPTPSLSLAFGSGISNVFPACPSLIFELKAAGFIPIGTVVE